MGRKINAKYITRSKTNKQLTLQNYKHDIKVKQLSEEYKKKQMIKKLDEAKVKYTKEDVIFVTNDSIKKVIWLEKGNDNRGLQHIIKNHNNDFKKAFNVEEKDIPEYLNNIVAKGKIVQNKVKKINGREGYERIYYYKGNYYVLISIGTNGFIITAYPIRKKGIKNV